MIHAMEHLRLLDTEQVQQRRLEKEGEFYALELEMLVSGIIFFITRGSQDTST